MATSTKNHHPHKHPLESDVATMHPLMSWRSVLAGLLIATLSMIGLLGLGLAFGGINMNADTSAKSAGIFTGIWFLVSALVSIFVGSYFAARVSKFQNGRIGSAQGLVIASLFLGFFLYQTVATIGLAGQAAGSFLGKAGSMMGQGAQKAAENPQVSSAIGNISEDAIGDLNLKSEPSTVATGLASRLVRGDAEGAKNYLARQAGITPTEADQRIATLKAKVDQQIDEAKNAASEAMQSAGWSLFLLVVLGALSAIAGGGLGSVANFRNPLSKEQYLLQHQTV